MGGASESVAAMKNTFGSAVTLTLFGESHGEWMGAVLDGVAPGLPVDENRIRSQLTLRRPQDETSTARREADAFSIVSGVYGGKTCGTPICLLIPNRAQNSADYQALRNIARPGHGDYAQQQKYHGFQDARGGGHGSGRITAPIVAAAGLLLPALEQKQICIRSHILRCGGISDRRFSAREAELREEMQRLKEQPFPVLEEEARSAMRAEILRAGAEKDSVGGVLETAICGLPAGLGEPWFDSVEGMLAHGLYSIPAVKGVSFGDGFALAERRGSESNDSFFAQHGVICTETNHNGGINGGITNGMPILIQTAIKPTPSIGLPQQTVDFETGEPTVLELRGRHDPCIVHRAAVVADSIAALTVFDLLTQRYGTDWWRT